MDYTASITSESGIVATLLVHPDFVYSSEKLLPNHFSNEQNRLVYQAIRNLVIDKDIKNIDAYNIIEELYSSPAMMKASSKYSVENIIDLIENTKDLVRNTVQEYKMIVNNVLDASFRRDMINTLDQCKYLSRESSPEDVKHAIYEQIDNVITMYATGDDEPQYKDKIENMWSQIKDRRDNGFAGIPFKFPSLNEFVTIEKGELVIFGAQQKQGKSIMLLNCAVDLLKKGKSVAYIDSELSDRLFTARILSHLTGVRYKALTSGIYNKEDGTAEEVEQKVRNAISWLKQANFSHIYMPFFDEENIYSTIQRQNHLQNLDVVIIDYFKSTGRDADAFQTYAAMGRITDLVKNGICGDLNIAAIGAAQATATNRLADSAKIARNASTIIMMMDKTPDEIEMDGPECGNKKLVVPFNRNGMQHAEGEYIDLMFDGNHILFEEAKQHIPVTPF